MKVGVLKHISAQLVSRSEILPIKDGVMHATRTNTMCLSP